MSTSDSANTNNANTNNDHDNANDNANNTINNTVTILGFGSLLSERSSRMTFPKLQNFRLGRVPNYRRVFAHPASVFFQRGIANIETKEMSSLSAEPFHKNNNNDSDNDSDNNSDNNSNTFVCSIFEVPNDTNEDDTMIMMKDGVPSQAFLEREEEFNIVMVDYLEMDKDGITTNTTTNTQRPKGILCTRSTDQQYIQRWGPDRFRDHYEQYGIHTIWGWDQNSGLRPCAAYLRHCVLAAQKMGDECYNSFLEDTYLVDRVTTVRTYLHQNPQVMTTLPPPELQVRYGG